MTESKKGKNVPEQWFEKAVEAAGVGIMLTDRDGVIEYVNPAFTHFTGFSPDEVLGKKPSILKSGRNIRAFYKYLWATILSGKRWNGEMVNHCKNGSECIAYLEIAPVKDEEGIHGFVATYQDISDLKEKEKDLIQASRSAEAATMLKDKFLSLVSHDLKGPLGTVINVLRMMEELSDPRHASTSAPMVKAAIESGKRMVDLIDELLSVGRLKTGKLKPQCKFIDVEKLALGPLAAVAYRSMEKGIIVRNDLPRTRRVYADRALVQEVVQNLLFNAVKFCSHGEQVRIYMPDDGSSTICVEDDGKGIGQERLAGLFDYGNEQSTTGTAGEVGTGLGLPLCREIMLAHNGDLEVTSKPGKGSIFSIKLPDVRPYIIFVGSNIKLLQHTAHIATTRLKCDTNILPNVGALDKQLNKQVPHAILFLLDTVNREDMEFIIRLKRMPRFLDLPMIAVLPGEKEAEEASHLKAAHIEVIVQQDTDTEELLKEIRQAIEPTWNS